MDLSASAPWAVAELVAAARDAGRPARIHLKIDTGLSRGGATEADWPELVTAAAKAAAAGEVEVIGIWSHFAYADAPGHPTIARQIDVFTEAVAAARRLGVDPPLKHLANSAATLTLPAAHFDLVRPGIAVYGLTPVPPEGYGLTPAMTLRSAVALAKRVPAGSGVSYGHVYVTETRDRAGPGPAGVRRRGARATRPRSARCSSPVGVARSRAGSAWTSSWSRWATTPSPPGTRWSCSARAPAASRPRRTGPRPPAPSRTRS